MDDTFSVGEILAPLAGKVLYGSPEACFNTYCIDSRYVREGCLFVPLLGQQRDGHQFILDALAQGATVSLMRTGHHLVPELLRVLNDSKDYVSAKYAQGITLVEVRHTLVALQKLASWYRRRFESVKVIGITGSVGKTQTKEMLLTILNGGRKVVGTDKNFNNEIGVPLTLSKLRRDTEFAVVEMAMRGRGEISLLSRIAQPDTGMITNTLGSHVGRLGSGIEVARAKAEIADGMKAGAKLWLNLNDRYLPIIIQELEAKQAIKRGLQLAYFDASSASTQTSFAPLIPSLPDDIPTIKDTSSIKPSIWLRNMARHGLDGSSLEICTPNDSVATRLNVLGRGAVENFLCAAALALDAGLELGDLASRSELIRPTPQRLVPYELANGVTLIDDSYNSSPASTLDALGLLAGLGVSNKLILVLGDMLELGKYETQMHKQIVEQVYKLPPALVIGVGPRMAALREGNVPAGFDVELFSGIADDDYRIRQGLSVSAPNKESASGSGMVDDATIGLITDRLLKEAAHAESRTVILVKGSRALHLERLVKSLLSYYGKEARML